MGRLSLSQGEAYFMDMFFFLQIMSRSESEGCGIARCVALGNLKRGDATQLFFGSLRSSTSKKLPKKRFRGLRIVQQTLSAKEDRRFHDNDSSENTHTET